MIKVFDFETCKKIGTKLSSENFFDWVDFALKNNFTSIFYIKHLKLYVFSNR